MLGQLAVAPHGAHLFEALRPLAQGEHLLPGAHPECAATVAQQIVDRCRRCGHRGIGLAPDAILPQPAQADAAGEPETACPIEAKTP